MLKPCVDSVLAYSNMTDVELIISANGCVDNTWNYLQSLVKRFEAIGMSHHFQYIWNDAPLGYSGANNVAITKASCDRIVLLSNDNTLLPQPRNTWLDLLNQPFETKEHTGISCVVKTYDPDTDSDWAMFFCVMIDRRVFDHIGLLNTEYEIGGCEDVEFSIEAQRAGFTIEECAHVSYDFESKTWNKSFPIYHLWSATLHDQTLVKDYAQFGTKNRALLNKKYGRNQQTQ